MCVQRKTLAASEHKSWSPFISWNFSLAVLAAISCMNVNLFCSVSDNPCFCFDMIPFHYFSANSIDILFHHAAQYHRSRCLQRGSAKGGNLNLDGATWFLPRGCPMGNLNISGVVKAWLITIILSSHPMVNVNLKPLRMIHVTWISAVNFYLPINLQSNAVIDKMKVTPRRCINKINDFLFLMWFMSRGRW